MVRLTAIMCLQYTCIVEQNIWEYLDLIGRHVCGNCGMLLQHACIEIAEQSCVHTVSRNLLVFSYVKETSRLRNIDSSLDEHPAIGTSARFAFNCICLHCITLVCVEWTAFDYSSSFTFCIYQ